MKQDLDDERDELDKDDPKAQCYGDKHTKKGDGTIRVWFTNPCGIGINPHKIKNHSNLCFLRYKSRCDVFGFAETNVNWHKLKGSSTFYARVKQFWRDFKTVTAHNTNMKMGVNQRGGTCMAVTGQLSMRVLGTGKDTTKLGRWSWIEFEGKDSFKTRVYTAYRPGGKPPRSSKKTTVYHQHSNYIREHNMNIEPKEMFDEDFIDELRENMSTSNLIVMLDANDDIRMGEFNKKIINIGMMNSITSRSSIPMPPTHHRGSKPISCIYHSKGVKVSRSGILPVGIGVGGDHRNMYVDYDTVSFLGNPMYMIKPPQMRRLQLQDSRIYKKFITSLKQHLMTNNILGKAESLLQNSTYPPNMKMLQEMEGIDEQVGRGIVSALKRCRKIKTGHIPYSALFNTIQKEQRLWLMVYKRKLGQKVSSTTIKRLAKRCKYERPLSYTMKEVLDKKKLAEERYQKLIPYAPDERTRFLEELAAHNAAAEKTTQQKVLKRIMQSESMRLQHGSIRKCFPKTKGLSKKVDRVEFTHEDGSTREVHHPRKLIQVLQQTNKAKYSCTENTPLMSTRMNRRYGNYAETSSARKMQQGEKKIPTFLPKWTQEMLKKTIYDPEIPRIKHHITKSEIQQTWRVTKEKKASSPSGRYNAVYKAMCLDEFLLNVLTATMNIPYTLGRPYKRWSCFLDIMAFKSPNTVNVDTLRSIILSEADWNASGRIFVTQKMMKQAEKLHLLPEEHLGGRKGKKSIDGAITKRVFMDNVRITRTPAIILSTDAANCYDRMVHKYVALMCNKWGLSDQIIRPLLEPLNTAKHFTRTAYGDSSEYFTGKNLQGAGQGNTSAAPFWTCVSTSMIQIMKEQGCTSKFTTPISKAQIFLTLIAFVDDTEVFLTDATGDVKELVEKAQRALNTWKGVLNATGGAMRAKKCAWILLSFITKHKDTKFHTKEGLHHEISVVDTDDIERNIKRYDHDTSREYLGVHQTASGKEDPQIKILNQHVENWNETIAKSKLPTIFNLHAMMNRIHKKLQYPLAATTITETQLQTLSDKLYSGSLHKCGIVRKFPIRYRTLPTTYHGLGLPDLYLEMSIGKLREIIKHSDTKSVLWQQIQNGLELAQMEAGVPDIIYNHPHHKYSILTTASWVTSIWSFTSHMQMNFSGWEHKLRLQRHNDRFIMASFTDSGYSGYQLRTLNRCRMYLEAFTLSDIVDGDGKKISENYLNGIKDTARQSTLGWREKTSRPSINDWYAWKQAIRTTFCRSDHGNTLTTPLGSWTTTEYHDWEWYYDPLTKKLFQKLKYHTRVYEPSTYQQRYARQRMRWYEITDIIEAQALPETLLRATVQPKEGSYKHRAFTGAHNMIKTIPTLPTRQIALDDIIQKNELLRESIKANTLQTCTLEEAQTIMSNELVLVSDGSHKTRTGSYATILETSTKSSRHMFSGPVSANPTDDPKNTDPYRSELFGLYIGLNMIAALEKVTGMSTKVTVACDNDSALDVVGIFDRWDTSMQHFDLIRNVIQTKNTLHSQVQAERVLGHADTKITNREYTRTEQLNQSCDKIAKAMRGKYTMPTPNTIQGEGLAIWMDNKKLYNDFDTKFRSKYYMQKAKTVICDQYSWTSEQFHAIQWDANEKAMEMLSRPHVIWVSKYVTHFLPIGRNMERRADWKESYCSRCSSCEETHRHLLRCNEEMSIQLFQEKLDELNTVLTKLQTPSVLQSQLIVMISMWRSDIHHPCAYPLEQPLQSQLRLGTFDHFMEGRIHKDFSSYMDKHYSSIGSLKNGHQWSKIVIQRIWSLLYLPMWQMRNKFVHKLDIKKIPASRKREDLQSRIREKYAQETKHKLLEKDQHLYDLSVTRLQALSNDAMVGWLECFKLATRDRDKIFDAENLQFQRTLRDWMDKPDLNATTDRATRTSPNSTHEHAEDDSHWNVSTSRKHLLRTGTWKPP